MINSKCSNVYDLLNGFDLPINQIAIDKGNNFIVSLECLRAIFTGKYVLPKIFNKLGKNNTYIESIIKNNEKISRVMKETSKKWSEPIRESYNNHCVSHKLIRMTNRVNKYKEREFTPIYEGDHNSHILFKEEYYRKESDY